MNEENLHRFYPSKVKVWISHVSNQPRDSENLAFNSNLLVCVCVVYSRSPSHFWNSVMCLWNYTYNQAPFSLHSLLACSWNCAEQSTTKPQHQSRNSFYMRNRTYYKCIGSVCLALTPRYSVVSRLSPDSSPASGWITSSVSRSASIRSSCKQNKKNSERCSKIRVCQKYLC